MDEYHHLKREIFTHNGYYFEPNENQAAQQVAPVIIDAGAHIGLATLYFKYLYPEAKIIAIEPNPLAFEILEANIFENQLENVQTFNLALSDKSETANFYLDKTENGWWSTAGFIEGAWTGDQQSERTSVKTASLSELIREPVDFLKMDIEGAELKVLRASESVLPLIKQLAVEFHPHSEQNLEDLVFLLEKHFQLTLYQDGREITFKKANQSTKAKKRSVGGNKLVGGRGFVDTKSRMERKSSVDTKKLAKIKGLVQINGVSRYR